MLSASHTLSGVSGMSMFFTPACQSASITAFTYAAGDPTVGDSPTPFAPSGWCGEGVESLADVELGRLPGGRDEVVREVRADAVAVLVEVDQLHRRDRVPLGEPAHDLALDDHRVDPDAAVVDRDHLAAASTAPVPRSISTTTA